MNRVIIASFFLFFATSVTGQQILPPRGEIEKIVREYILQHPEVLIQSVQSLQETQRSAMQREAGKVIALRRKDLVDSGSPAAGHAPGKTPVVMFFDYRCGYCRRSDDAVLKLAEGNSGAYVIFKELPILGQESMMASGAALAADKQGAYVKFHRALMAANGPITLQTLEQTASELGLNLERFRSDMKSPEIAETLQRNRELADALGVRATPSFVIGSELVVGALDPTRFQQLIARAGTAQTERQAQ
jgi:protein-disulfide isomerase